MENSRLQTYMCFCSLPEADNARDAEFAVGSAVILKEETTIALQNNSDTNFQELILRNPMKLFSCIITNKRFRTYNGLDKDVPHTILASMLFERVAYSRDKVECAFNTFISTPRPQDYRYTLNRLLVRGIREEEYDGHAVDKEIFSALNIDFASDSLQKKFTRAFGITNFVNEIISQRLKSLSTDITSEERYAWNVLRPRYGKSKEGKIEGYGIKVYPDKYIYKRL